MLQRTGSLAQRQLNVTPLQYRSLLTQSYARGPTEVWLLLTVMPEFI